VLGAGLVLGIALSRVLLGAHTAMETFVGLAIGGATLVAIAPSCIRAKPKARQIAGLFAAIALTLLVLHGRSISFDEVWRSSATYLQGHLGLCGP